MLSLFLFPFSLLYGLVTRVRNFLYDLGWKKSFTFDPAVISVGNLSVGGTGKTPMIEFLVNALAPKYSIAILSRGYGRNTRGYLQAERHDDATTIGDEPFQFYRKFGDKITVIVCERRVEGINRLIKKKQDVQVILLDDAFQHRSVKPLFSILLTDFSRPFFSDHLLPMGRLREGRKGSARADAIVVTKCPDLSGDVERAFTESLQHIAGPKPVFFTHIGYRPAVSLEGTVTNVKNVVLVTGIANSRPLVDYVSSRYSMIDHFQFNDHHHYSAQDVELIQKRVSDDTVILTTEKDMVKLISPAIQGVINGKLWFYLPIETQFVKNGSEFDELVIGKIESHLSSLRHQNQK